MQVIDEHEAVGLLSKQIVEGKKPIVFMFGSGSSMPKADCPDALGVPGSARVVQIIAGELGLEPSDPGLGGYQEAFRRLIGERGLGAANRVIRIAVLRARRKFDPADADGGPESLAALEADTDGWWLPAAYQAVALLAAHYPAALGGTVLTTNFDPLIEVAMARARTPWLATALHGDGSLLFTRGSGPHVVHLHGHWWNSDTLHTETQLMGRRRRLRSSLVRLLARSTLVVVGYGGWPDVLTTTLRTLSGRDVVWCVRGRVTDDAVARLAPLVGAGGRVVAETEADSLLRGILDAALHARPAATAPVYLERLLVHNNHSKIYQISDDPAFRTSDRERISGQLDRLEQFKAGSSILAAIQAARFLLGLLDQQGANQAYAWSDGSVLRLLLQEALRVHGDENTNPRALELGDKLAAILSRDRRIPGRIAGTAIEAVQCALCATISFQGFQRLRAARPGLLLERLETATGYAGWREEQGVIGQTLKFPYRTWSGKAAHLAMRSVCSDYRSLVQYAKSCMESEDDHQDWYDRACRSIWETAHAEGRQLDRYIADLLHLGR